MTQVFPGSEELAECSKAAPCLGGSNPSLGQSLKFLSETYTRLEVSRWYTVANVKGFQVALSPRQCFVDGDRLSTRLTRCSGRPRAAVDGVGEYYGTSVLAGEVK